MFNGRTVFHEKAETFTREQHVILVGFNLASKLYPEGIRSCIIQCGISCNFSRSVNIGRISPLGHCTICINQCLLMGDPHPTVVLNVFAQGQAHLSDV